MVLIYNKIIKQLKLKVKEKNFSKESKKLEEHYKMFVILINIHLNKL